MPSDDYASIARGPLKLKGGAGVTKKKKKKDKAKTKSSTDLERNLSAGVEDNSENALALSESTRSPRDAPPEDEGDERRRSASNDRQQRDEPGEREEDESKTESERRFAEAKRKRVRLVFSPPTHPPPLALGCGVYPAGERRKANGTSTQQLKELTESGRIRPELLKTHKQRVEELNAHLARLSEHHDMPKIGPG
jgi:protein FAM32A